MPQFDTRYFPSEIFWTLVAFALLFMLLKWLVLPRIIAIIDERTRIMKEEMDQARYLHEQAEHLHADYAERLAQAEKEAKEMFDESTRHAREHRNELMAEWKQEMERRKREFREDIETEKQRAMREMRARSADLVVAASEKILRERVDKKTAQDALNELLGELEPRSKDRNRLN